MGEYINLLKIFKVGEQNLLILHRHLMGTNWFGTHEQIEKYYEKVSDDLDYLCELGLSIEIDEPTMKQSLETYEEIEIRNRDYKDSYEIIKSFFDDIVVQINRISELPEDVINKLLEIQVYYRLESEYKLFRAIKANDEIER